MKYKYRNGSFWCRGYYVDSLGKNEIAIRKYIDNQLKEDMDFVKNMMQQFGSIREKVNCR